MTARAAVVCAYLGSDVAKTKLDVVLSYADRCIHQVFANTPEGFEALDSWLQQLSYSACGLSRCMLAWKRLAAIRMPSRTFCSHVAIPSVCSIPPS